jgi:hypothetical protein
MDYTSHVKPVSSNQARLTPFGTYVDTPKPSYLSWPLTLYLAEGLSSGGYPSLLVSDMAFYGVI